MKTVAGYVSESSPLWHEHWDRRWAAEHWSSKKFPHLLYKYYKIILIRGIQTSNEFTKLQIYNVQRKNKGNKNVSICWWLQVGDFPHTLRKLKAFKWNETSVPPDVTQLWHHLSKNSVSLCQSKHICTKSAVQCTSLYLARSSTTSHHRSVDPIDIYQLKN